MTDDASLAPLIAAAEELIDEGEQGEAQQLLSQALAGASSARSADEAAQLARATGLLIALDLGLVPAEAIAAHLDRMRRLTEGFDGETVSAARAEAELQTIEWVHAEEDGPDPIVLVDVLRRAEDFSARGGSSPHVAVRRAAAEAALTAQMIRSWLDQDPSSIAVALESLALSLAGEEDERLRQIRVAALNRSAEIRITAEEDPEHARFLLRTVVEESDGLPGLLDLRSSALRMLAELAIADGTPIEEALTGAFAALRVDHEGDARSAWLRCRHLDLLLGRLPEDRIDAVTAHEWGSRLARAATEADPRIRDAVLSFVLFRADADGPLAPRDLGVLRLADDAFRGDRDPLTVETRFRVAARIVEALGTPGTASADPGLAVRLSEETEKRFEAEGAWSRLAPEQGRLLLDRALRLSDLGMRDQALAILGGFRARFATADDPARMRHLQAQADYWTARLLRERGETARAGGLVEAMVAEYGVSSDVDVRLWAGKALFSAWRAESADDAAAEAAFGRFTEAFGEERDAGFRRLDASGRASLAHRAHERGDSERAVELFRDVASRHGDDDDPEVAETVRLARENLGILSLRKDAPAGPDVDERYRTLRDRLFATDALVAQGRAAEAEEAWRTIVEEAAPSSDPHVVLLSLAALDAWSGELAEAGRWTELAEVARRATVIREGLDVRGERVRARAHLRYALALAKLDDPRGAVAVYDALEQLVATSDDDELVTIRQQAAYNRAVQLDDLGDVAAALHAYDHVLALHAARVDSAERRLRRVKALRNKALLLDGLGRIAEAAGAHRLILDIASASPDAELGPRARASAFDLAGCFARLGDPASAAATYDWIRRAPGLGFTETEVRDAARRQKAAEREARRLRR